VPTFCELQKLRDELFGLLLEPEPGQARDLYLLAGLACGMLAHASGNLGDLRAAHLQACTALACARKADHPTLAAWILGVRALQCEWNGRPDETVTAETYAREARRAFDDSLGGRQTGTHRGNHWIPLHPHQHNGPSQDSASTIVIQRPR
jgi:hypothetical protein